MQSEQHRATDQAGADHRCPQPCAGPEHHPPTSTFRVVTEPAGPAAACLPNPRRTATIFADTPYVRAEDSAGRFDTRRPDRYASRPSAAYGRTEQIPDGSPVVSLRGFA
ncbi:hypothetical protein Vlu01_37910 [Micromonospora lutea]|uniref:Uncharacterized protein n=1 Tax=Micromonospora lutea TaxID=419825 RepID=A0ABQ4IZ44_9ACTN|nr:hypothetical protein Vlu01_37910 [Micromonospora lutea]